MNEAKDRNVIVSVVVPTYNEERYIENCLLSLLEQDYPKEQMEWIFVDGGSTDDTARILKNHTQKYPEVIKLYSNPNKTAPCAMNIGIKAAVGKYIIRLDAHSEYARDYISKCVYYLEHTGADNVGGVIETKGEGFAGRTIALMMSSKFGVGNSQFRTNGKDGYVDTVPFGAFRREVFDRYGYYNEKLTRNQDYELNYRIRKNGGRIYMARDIRLSYYCRDTIKGIISSAVQNGKWNVITMRLCPGAMSVRHFVPLAFLLSLVLLPLLSAFGPAFSNMLVAEVALYVSLDVFFSVQAARELKQIPLLLILFPMFHLSYGFGSLVGVISRTQ